jgi:hypothetical protein
MIWMIGKRKFGGRYSVELLLVFMVALLITGCRTNNTPGSTAEAKPKPEATATDEVDAFSGLKVAPGWETVRTHCIACHSGRHFLRQTGTRDTWEDAIRWMQANHGLWQIPPADEKVILDYLAVHYAPRTDDYRRAPLPWSQLPPNPYGTPIPVTAPNP